MLEKYFQMERNDLNYFAWFKYNLNACKILHIGKHHIEIDLKKCITIKQLNKNGIKRSNSKIGSLFKKIGF